jgi:hypothetical protein
MPEIEIRIPADKVSEMLNTARSDFAANYRALATEAAIEILAESGMTPYTADSDALDSMQSLLEMGYLRGMRDWNISADTDASTTTP